MFDERVKDNLILRVLLRRFRINVGSILVFLKYNNGFLFILNFSRENKLLRLCSSMGIK